MTDRASTDRSRKNRILLVDDHPIVRQGLAQLINSEADLAVCAEAEDAARALAAADANEPDLAIVDISLKDRDGLEVVKDLKARHPDLLMLVLSMHDETLYAERALRAGARGYVMKQEASGVVMGAIRSVLGGGVYLSEKMKSRLLHRLAGEPAEASRSPVQGLSDRELEVFQLIGRGHETKQIANELHLSVKTVEAYRAKIKQKLNIRSATEMLRYAVQWVESGGRK